MAANSVTQILYRAQYQQGDLICARQSPHKLKLMLSTALLPFGLSDGPISSTLDVRDINLLIENPYISQLAQLYTNIAWNF